MSDEDRAALRGLLERHGVKPLLVALAELAECRAGLEMIHTVDATDPESRHAMLCHAVALSAAGAHLAVLAERLKGV